MKYIGVIFFFLGFGSVFAQQTEETKVPVEQIETIRAQDVQVVSGTYSGSSVLNALETLKALDDDDLDKSSTNELQQLTENQNSIGLTNSSFVVEKIIRDGNNGFYYLGPVNFNSSKVLFEKNAGRMFLRNATASTRITLDANDDAASTFRDKLFVGTSDANFSSEKFAVNGNIFAAGDYLGYAGTANARSPITQNIISVDSAFTEVIEELQNSADGDGDPTNELQDLTLNGTDLEIENGNSVDLAVLQDGVNDADSNPTNELQDLTFNSFTGTVGLTQSTNNFKVNWRSGGNGIIYSLPGNNSTSKFYFFESVGKMGWRNVNNSTRILLSAEDDEFSWIFNNFQVGAAGAISNEKFSVAGNSFITGNYLGYAGTARATNPLTGATNQTIDAILTEMNANSVSYWDYNSIQNSLSNAQGAYLGMNKTSPEYAFDVRSTGSEQYVGRFQSNVSSAEELLVKTNSLYAGIQNGESASGSTHVRLYPDGVGIGVTLFNNFLFTSNETFKFPTRSANPNTTGNESSIYVKEFGTNSELHFIDEEENDRVIGYRSDISNVIHETNDLYFGKKVYEIELTRATINPNSGGGFPVGYVIEDVESMHLSFQSDATGATTFHTGGGQVVYDGSNDIARVRQTTASNFTVFNDSLMDTLTNLRLKIRFTQP